MREDVRDAEEETTPVPHPGESLELDLVHSRGRELAGFEIKSSSTDHSSFQQNLKAFHERVAPLRDRYVVYSGEERRFSDGSRTVPFRDVGELL